MSPDNVTINEGTGVAIAADNITDVLYQRVKLDVGADGLTSAFTGTVAQLSNIAAGTITKLGGGTVTNLASGSVVLTGGTVQTDPTPPTYITTYGTLLAGAGSTWATLSAASGAGTYHYVSGVSIVVKSGTVDSAISFGTVLGGTGLIERGSFPEGGGIAKSYWPSLKSSGTNSEICAEIAGAGTVEFKAEFWRGV